MKWIKHFLLFNYSLEKLLETEYQHPTIAEELKAASQAQCMEVDSLICRKMVSEIRLPANSNPNNTSSEVPKRNESAGLSTILEHQNNKFPDQEQTLFDVSEISLSNSSSNSFVRRSASLKHRPTNITPSSPILELSESRSSQETIECDNRSKNGDAYKRENMGINTSNPCDKRDLYKRMASDTDLWMSINSRPSKFQSNLEATKETPERQPESPCKLIHYNWCWKIKQKLCFETDQIYCVFCA